MISLEKTTVMLLSFSLVFQGVLQETSACTTVMAGKKATADGSVLMSSSCDGNQMGRLYIMPAREYAAGERVAMSSNGRDVVGHLPPLERTYRSIILGDGALGGMNEHGVSIALEYIPTRTGLTSLNGLVGPFSGHWTTSLIANGLMRAKTAREAIRLIGAMVEEHGFLYTWGGNAGVALPIADKNEVWLLEIFGPEENWTAQSGTPGGVWCAQRIPDDAVGVSANRSRIGAVDVENADEFIASANIFTLAKRLGFWEEGDEFVWSEVYGESGGRGNCLREWRALSLVAPSRGLEASGDPLADRYPFSVRPDQPLTVSALMDLMRDGYEGTEFDVTGQASFQAGGQKSPLARPWGPRELFSLLEIKPERAINTPESTFVYVAQARNWLPDAIGNLVWFAYGPAHTSCFVPIYAGATELPDSWIAPPQLGSINRQQVQWNYRLVCNLANNLKYQDVMRDVQQVIQPAEEEFLRVQPDFENAARRILERDGQARAEAYITDYVNRSMTQVGSAYDALVDYLMFKYLYDRADIAPPTLPTIASPIIPDPSDPPAPSDRKPEEASP